MPAALTLHGIDEAISNLGYKNANSPKARLISAIRTQYTDPTVVDKIQQIGQDPLIRKIWGNEQAASALRSRRKNLASVRSSVNADLKKLFDGHRNPEGVTISPAYVFAMLDDAKDRLLSSLGNTLQPGENVSLTQIAKMLDLAGRYLKNHDHQEAENAPQGMEELKAVIGNLTRLVDTKTAPQSATEKNQSNFNWTEGTAPGESLPATNKMTEKNRIPENDQAETPFSNRPLLPHGAAENHPPGGPATDRASDSRKAAFEDRAANGLADPPESNFNPEAAQRPEKPEGELLSREGPEAPATDANSGTNPAAATPSISSEAKILAEKTLNAETPPPSPAPSQGLLEDQAAAPHDQPDSISQNNAPSFSENISGHTNSAPTSLTEITPSSETLAQKFEEIVDIIEVLDDGEETEDEIVEEDSAEFDSFEGSACPFNGRDDSDAGHGQNDWGNGGNEYDRSNMPAEGWEPATDGSLSSKDDLPPGTRSGGFEPEPFPPADASQAEDSNPEAVEFYGSKTSDAVPLHTAGQNLAESSEEGSKSGDSDGTPTSGTSGADSGKTSPTAPLPPENAAASGEILETDDAEISLAAEETEFIDVVDAEDPAELMEDMPEEDLATAPVLSSAAEFLETSGLESLDIPESNEQAGDNDGPGAVSGLSPAPANVPFEPSEADGLPVADAAGEQLLEDVEDAPIELVDLVNEVDDIVKVAPDDELLEAAAVGGDTPGSQALATSEGISGNGIAEAADPDALMPMDSPPDVLEPPELHPQDDDADPQIADPAAQTQTDLDTDDATAGSAPDDPADSRLPTEIGLPFDPLDQNDSDTAIDPEDLRSHKLLAEKFDGYLGVMERYYNQYLLIPKKKYVIGRQNPLKGELEARDIRLPEFYLGKFPITNALFEVFVDRTGYATTAEKCGEGTVYRGRFQKVVDPESGQLKSVWHASNRSEVVKGACWYQPFGPGSTLHNKRNHPVVQVSLKDALAFAAWTGKRLPREAEWEAAARTDEGHPLPWGQKWLEGRCNTEEAGIADTTPVDDFPEGTNALGISDCLGNVLEWTLDEAPPIVEDRGQPALFIAKGGSWISDSSIRLCSRFRFSADFCANILGFRCLAD